MNKFKIGDKVKIIEEYEYKTENHGIPKNLIIHGMIGGHKDAKIVDVYNEYLIVNFINKNGKIMQLGYLEDSLELVEESKIINNKIELNMKEKFITMFLSEPEKSFRKAGITNGDGMLTNDGKTIFLAWLLKKEGNTFKTEVVDELIKEESCK